jgi:hypothetical protein
MKKYLHVLSLMVILGSAILVFSQCKKDTDDTVDPTPTDPLDKFYNKWWYPVSTYGDFYFNSNGTCQYKFFATTTNGTYVWYSNKDSMRIVEETGGEWTAWFREIKDNSFKMSRGNEDHLNIYNYTDVKP